MQEDDVLGILYKFFSPLLVVIVWYFLRSILSTIKKLQEDVSKFRVDHAATSILLQEHRERLDKIQSKLDKYDDDLKLFFMEYGAVLKKAKKDYES